MDMTRALADMLAFMKEAGALAKEGQGKVASHMKADASIVTETDLAISKLAHARLADWLSQPGHILLDEESIDGVGMPEHVFTTTTYQWVLDPIDGTASYAAGRMGYGISLGLLHRGEPLLGVIYLPAQDTLFVATDNAAYCETAPFTPHARHTPLVCKPFDMNNQVFVETYFSAHMDWGNTFKNAKVWADRPDSAVEGFTLALAGRAAGATAITDFSIWDMAAAAAMAKRAGFTVLSMKDGTPFTRFDAQNIAKNWKLGVPWLLSAAENFGYISAAIKGE